jgi:hypothetical protein
MTKGGFPVPIYETCAAFEDAIRAKPERVFRLIALVQAAADQSKSVRNAVLRLAEAGLSGLDLALSSPIRFDVVAWSWVRRVNERPLSRLQPGALFLLLRVGSHRQLVDASVAALLKEAATRPANPPDAVPSRKK